MKKFSFILTVVFLLAAAAFGQDVKLKILEQPKPELPLNFTTLDVQGTVILRIQFLDFGEIGEVTAVKELPSGLTEKAIAAARRIKFEPEKKDGKPVTIYRQLEYAYSWNGGWRIPSGNTETTPATAGESGKAETIVAKAIQTLGGDRYLQVKSQVGRGKFSSIKEGAVVSFQTFSDAIIFPDRERTDFKGGGARMTQVNTGNTGWIFDESMDVIRAQTEVQVENFKRGLRTSLDNLLRGYWKGQAELTYVGRRPATLGKRNDVVRLTYKDDFTVEFEFATDDGTPQKAIYQQNAGDGAEPNTEEDHYAQFVDVGGVKSPFIIDRFTNGKQSSRINYDSIELNKSLPDSIFAKPASIKDAKKDLKY